MKKLKLDFQSLNAEVLTRNQLKQILGGDDGSGGGAGGKYKCCPKGQPDSQFCSTCVTVPAGSHAVCSQGVVTSC